MCEFKVILEDGQEKKAVAKGIVKAKLKDGKVVLMSTAGIVAKVEGASIVTVDTMMAELVLRSDGEQKASTAEGSPPVPASAAPGGSLPEELAALKRFHGHLGPYVVLGMRMGQFARERFPNRIYATVMSGTKRPLSCLADGVQFASCCTIGKSNLAVQEGGRAVAMFTDGRTGMALAVNQELLASLEEGVASESEDAVSLRIYQEKGQRLFSMKAVDPTEAWREG